MWIKKRDMDAVHAIRQGYSQAIAAGDDAALKEATERRARAIRAVHEEDSASVRHLAAMFRCSKTAVREALESEHG